MKLNDMKMRLNEIASRIGELEQSELQSYAQLGRLMLPDLEEGKHADIAAQIRAAAEKLAAMRAESASLEIEHKRRLAELTCFTCNAVNGEDSVFCEECGAKLGEKPKEYCEACSTMNRPGQKFCGECGAKLAADPATPAGSAKEEAEQSIVAQPKPEAGAFCSECGAKLASDANFCPECGARTV